MMPISNRRAERLALLVGSNPLPNYLAAVILEPRGVVLIHSPETREPRDHLRAALTDKDSTIAMKDCADGMTAEFHITEQSKRGGIKARIERLVS